MSSASAFFADVVLAKFLYDIWLEILNVLGKVWSKFWNFGYQ
jgi:hypothetical protein